MNIWIFIFIYLQNSKSFLSTGILMKDFKLFSKEICKVGCSKITCHSSTLISIDSIQPLDNSNCSPINHSIYLSQFNCYSKFLENHILKICANTISCQICMNDIESEHSPNTQCKSEHDLLVKYRCMPGYIKNENICANSYLDIDCFEKMKEKLVIHKAILYTEIKKTDDSSGCSLDLPKESVKQCRPIDKTNYVINKCSYREKCSVGPHEYTSSTCKNMHLRLNYACVHEDVLENVISKPVYEKPTKANTIKKVEVDSETNSWFKKHKWTILGISVSIVVVSSVTISFLICLNKRNHTQRNFDVNIPKDNLFNKLGQQKFTPPPSSIDKVNVEFENGTLTPPDIYNSNSDTEESNMRSKYPINIHSTMSYNSQFCNSPPLINTCQYFSPLLQPGHINMLEMPAIQLASSGNLTSSTINSSHGTPRGTKSSGIYSMTDMSFENTHLV